MSYLSDLIYEEKKLVLIMGIDHCRIVQLIKHFNGVALAPHEFLFHRVEIERLSLDDYFSGLFLFFKHSEIGEFDYDSRYASGAFKIEVNAFSEILARRDEFTDAQETHFNMFLENWLRTSGPVTTSQDFDEYFDIHCHVELTILNHTWYSFCCDIIELHNYCTDLLKELA